MPPISRVRTAVPLKQLSPVAKRLPAEVLPTNVRSMADGPVDSFEPTRRQTRAEAARERAHVAELATVRSMADAARAAGVPPELPVMVSLVESRLRNVNYGDADSVGLFQQRRPWGTRARRMDPDIATHMFLYGGHSPGTFGAQHFAADYGQGPFTDTQLGRWAQDVQGSAFPDRYQAQAPAARALLREAGVEGY